VHDGEGVVRVGGAGDGGASEERSPARAPSLRALLIALERGVAAVKVDAADEKGGEDAAGVDGGFGEGGRALVPVLGGRLGQDWTERGKGRGEIFFEERGELFGDLGNRAELPESSGVSVERRDGGWNWRAWVRRVGYAGMNVPFSPTSESARLLMPASRKRLDLRSFGEGRVGRGQRLGKFNSSSGETSRFLKQELWWRELSGGRGVVELT
jgi:hypothetical protein